MLEYNNEYFTSSWDNYVAIIRCESSLNTSSKYVEEINEYIISFVCTKEEFLEEVLDLYKDAKYNFYTDMLIEDEGFELTPYKCTAGKTTIGVGRNLDVNGISENEAMQLLYNDIENVIIFLKQQDLYDNHPLYVRKALVNMVFNLGFSGFLKFKKTIALIKEGNYEEAAKEVKNSKWYQTHTNRVEKVSALLNQTFNSGTNFYENSD